MTTLKNNLNIFKGSKAIRNFLDPDCSPPLPLVEIPKELNPFYGDGVRIFAKLMNFVPLGNIKSLPAYNMLSEEKKRNGLKDIHTLIENSSGNTAFSLAVIGRIFGIPKIKAIVSHEVTWGKLQLLRLFGTEIFVNEEPLCPDPNDKESGIYLAKKRGNKKGWLNPGQYDNEANPRSHEKYTGPQIWKQMGEEISIFCSGCGTTGTIIGVSKYLKKKRKKLITVGVVRKPNNPVPGVRTSNLLKEIAFDWKKHVDHIEEIGTKESFELSMKLCRCGLLVGPSSGFAFGGLINFLKERKNAGKLSVLKNKNNQITAVFICPDGPLPYLNEYFEYLDESYFPKIENEKLLINKPDSKDEKKRILRADVFEIEAEDAYHLLYPISKKILWEIVNEEKKIPINKDVLIIDVRTDTEFSHFHLPGSKHIELQKLTKQLTKLQRETKNKKVIFVCKTGNRSGAAMQLARTKNIDALNLGGGATEWSRLNLPRVRPKICR